MLLFVLLFFVLFTFSFSFLFFCLLICFNFILVVFPISWFFGYYFLGVGHVLGNKQEVEWAGRWGGSWKNLQRAKTIV